jgi:hypothetical protein
MSTIHLQFKQGLEALIAAAPGIEACYTNRPGPVGENEPKPVVIIRGDVARAEADNQETMALKTQLRVSLFFDLVAGGESLDEISDPHWITINNIMHGGARDLPGVQGVEFLEHQPEPEGDAGRLDLVYLVTQRTHQLDLTRVPPT